MISALTRQIDPNAGECFKYFLLQMYARTDPWKVVCILICNMYLYRQWPKWKFVTECSSH